MCFQMKTTNRWAPSKHRLSFLMEPEFGHDHRRKFTLQFLAVLLLCLSPVPATFGCPQRAATNDAQPATSSLVGTVNVITGQGHANNLASVPVKSSDTSTGSLMRSMLTDEGGRFQFAQLATGTYTIEVNSEGFKPFVKTIVLGEGQAAAQDATLEISSVDQQIEVRGENIEVDDCLANRRLGNVDTAGSFAIALPLHDRGEITKVTQFHVDLHVLSM